MKRKVKILTIVLFSLLLPTVNSTAQEAETIKEYLEQVLPPQEGRRIVLDEATGILTITDTPSNHKLIRRLIETWDIGPRQISIEAKFVEISEGALKELGVEWMGTRSDTSVGGDIERRRKDGTFYIGGGPIRGDTETVLDRPAVYDSSLYNASEITEYKYDASRAVPPWSGTEFGAPADVSGLGLWIGRSSLSGSELYAYLRALDATDKASLLSAPRVTTLSGQMANIELANTIPYATTVEITDTRTYGFGKFETYEIDEKKTGIFLEVTPSVGKGSDIITLDLHPEVSEIVRQVPITDSDQFPHYLGWPIVDTRSTQTTVNVKSGQTIIIGGLIRDDEVVYNRKVPLLGSIPILGNLFRYKCVDKSKTNLVIFLTATIISAEGEEIK